MQETTEPARGSTDCQMWSKMCEYPCCQLTVWPS